MKTEAIKIAALCALVGAALYLSFELGRTRAGFSVLDERRRTDAAGDELAFRDEAIQALERELAILRTSQEIDEETYSGIEASFAELEARIQAQEEELAFYRGIVSPGDGVPGLRIQNVEIAPGQGGAAHTLRVLLVQAIVHSDRVTGTLKASLRGMEDGNSAEYGLDRLSFEEGAGDIPFGFRYFQNLEIGLTLPAGFEPAEIEIEVWPARPRSETIIQSFPWSPGE